MEFFGEVSGVADFEGEPGEVEGRHRGNDVQLDIAFEDGLDVELDGTLSWAGVWNARLDDDLYCILDRPD